MKDYRDKELKNLLFILFFLFLIWCTPALDFSRTSDGQSEFFALSTVLESAVVSAVLSCASVLCDCIISSEAKDKLVGLFLIPRAGETIFSKIQSGQVTDARFSTSDAATLYADAMRSLPNETKARRNAENIIWYRIYQKHQEKGQVRQGQHDYLMCRDLYIETLAFLTMYVLSLCVFPAIAVFSAKFLTLLVFLAIAFNICTHQKMKRFVTTVIAVDVAQKLNSKESGSTQ